MNHSLLSFRLTELFLFDDWILFFSVAKLFICNVSHLLIAFPAFPAARSIHDRPEVASVCMCALRKNLFLGLNIVSDYL